MSLAYLPEHLDNALSALDLATREANHLAYTSNTLFAQPIDLDWVNAIAKVVSTVRQHAQQLGLSSKNN